MNPALAPALAATFRRASAPLAWYYGVTLGIPLANGAAHAGAAFVEHALAVLVLPPALITVACVAREIARASCVRTRCRSRGAQRSVEIASAMSARSSIKSSSILK